MKQTKQRMAKYLLVILTTVLVTSSCSVEYLLERKEDRIVGAWEFEKVTFKKDGRLFAENITHHYHNDIVEFLPDYTAYYDDFSERVVFNGEWLIRVDKDDVSKEFFVDAVFYDFLSGQDFWLFGSIDRLNRRVLKFEAWDNNGKYVFRLNKL